MLTVRLSKLVMVAGLALFALLVAADNVTDYGSNEAFVRHGHRQVGAGEDRKAASLIGAAASCGSFGARDLGPDREGLRPDGSVLGGGEVIAVEMEEVVDLVVGGEEPLYLAG